MAGLAFAASLGIESAKDSSTPAEARTSRRPPAKEELDAIELPNYGLTHGRPSNEPISTPKSHDDAIDPYNKPSAPQTPNELERSQPPTPKQDNATTIVPSWRHPSMNKYRILAGCTEYFGNGLNDAAPGALIPYIERWYGIGYALVSLIWITSAVGFIIAAFTTDFIIARLGRAKSLIFSECCMIAAYVIIACPVPFAGGGSSAPSVILGIAHGTYGVAGIAGPLVAMSLVANGVHWQRIYLIPIAVRSVCMAAVGYTFWGYEKDETQQARSRLEQLTSRQSQHETGAQSKLRLIGRALKIRTTIIGALFIFAYQGAEVSESGWFISYLIDYRNGDPA